MEGFDFFFIGDFFEIEIVERENNVFFFNFIEW